MKVPRPLGKVLLTYSYFMRFFFFFFFFLFDLLSQCASFKNWTTFGLSMYHIISFSINEFNTPET